jgi:rubredoxin
MAVWKCVACGNTVTAEVPPELCPGCSGKCEYVDVTCYIPECGGPGPGNVNPQAFERSGGEDRSNT